MNKKAILVGGGVIALAVIYFATLAYTGKAAQKFQDEAYAKITESVPYIEVVERHYQRGFFTSTETAILRFSEKPDNAFSEDADEPNAPTSDDDLRIELKSHIRHGPFLGAKGLGAASIETKIVFTDKINEALAKVFGENTPVITLDTKVSLSGSLHTLLKSPATKYSDDTGSFSWEGLEGVIDITSDAGEIRHHLTIPGVEFQTNRKGEGTFTAQSSLFGCEGVHKKVFKNVPNGYGYLGNASCKLKSLSIASDTFSLQADEFFYSLDTPIKDNFLNVVGVTTLKNLKMEKVANDQLFPVNDFSFRWSLNHLNLATSEEMAMIFSKIATNHPADLDPFDRVLTQSLSETAKKFLPDHPTFVIEQLSAELPIGKINATANASFADESGENFDPAITAKLSVPAQMATFIPMLKEFSAQGYFAKEEDKLSTEFIFKNNHFTLNGKPLR